MWKLARGARGFWEILRVFPPTDGSNALAPSLHLFRPMDNPLEALEPEASHLVVFSSAVGVSALLGEAERLGRLADLRRALERSRVICRGRTALAALQRVGVNTGIQAKEPYTIIELMAALAPWRLEKQFVVLLHYGARNLPLAESLLGRCAGLQELRVHDWHVPKQRRAVLSAMSAAI